MALLVSIVGSVIGTLIVGPVRWLWNKITGRPTVQATERSVAGGRDVTGQVTTGDQPTVAGQAGVQMGPGSVTHIHQQGLDAQSRERLVRMEGLLNEIKGGMASPQLADAETRDLARAATERTEKLVTEAVDLRRQHKEREAIERLLTAYEMDLPPRAKLALHVMAGNGFARLSEFEEARGHFRQALAAAETAGDREGKAAALGNIAAVHAEQGNLDFARKKLEEVLPLDRQCGNRVFEAGTVNNLGVVYRKLGLTKGEPLREVYLNQAELYLTEALTIYQKLGNHSGEAAALANLGILYADQLQVERAHDFHSKGLAIARRIGDRSLEAKELGNLGSVYMLQDDFGMAIEHHEAALAIDKHIENVLGQAQDLGNLGTAYRQKGETERAKQYYSQALKIFQEVGAKYEVEQCERLLNAL